MSMFHGYSSNSIRRALSVRMLPFAMVIMAIFYGKSAAAHQAPYSIVFLDVSPDRVGLELQIPLAELALAYGSDIGRDPESLVKRMGPQLGEYILAHTRVYVHRELPWLIWVSGMSVGEETQITSGPPFYELRVRLTVVPQAGESTRHFMLDYDAVVHQVVNHIVFVAVRSDWQTGRADSLTAEGNPMTIRTAGDNKIHPLEISLEKGSWFTGVRNMFLLGIEHIREGTDHLLFLIALLLPATLVTNKHRWAGYGGLKPSLSKTLKIVTAFTIGHSLTLLIGALGWVHLPAQAVEVCIAVSILVSAVHAIYPIFPGHEMFVAGGFGLVHGLAFAGVISNLSLGAGTLACSILGFNLGIEVMQLGVILLIIPWLILLSQTGYYRYVRIGGAIFAGLAAMGWIVERVSGERNSIGIFAEQLSGIGVWIILGLAALALLLFWWSGRPGRRVGAAQMQVAHKNQV